MERKPPPGQKINIKTTVNYWGQQYLIALVGDRYLVTAYAHHAPTRITSMTLGGSVPLWWRDIPYDFSLPLFQGEAYISSQRESIYLTMRWPSVNAFHQEVTALLTAPPDIQELRLLHSQVKKYFPEQSKKERGEDAGQIIENETTIFVRQVREKLLQTTTVERFINTLFEERQQNPSIMNNACIIILSNGGRQETLRVLLKIQDNTWPEPSSKLQEVIDEICLTSLLSKIDQAYIG